MSILRDLEVMLHGQLFVVVRLQLLSQFLIVHIFLGGNKESAILTSGGLCEREHVGEHRVLCLFLVPAVPLLVLLLDQCVAESRRHLDLALTAVVAVILCALLVNADYFFFEVEVVLIVTLLPGLSFENLAFLLLLYKDLLDPQLLDSWVVLFLVITTLWDGEARGMCERWVNRLEETAYC